jgi:hypothetical protein
VSGFRTRSDQVSVERDLSDCSRQKPAGVRGRVVLIRLQTHARRRDDHARGSDAEAPAREPSFRVSQRFMPRPRDDTAVALIRP